MRYSNYSSVESQGVIAAGIFLILMFIMIAIVFSEHLHPQSDFLGKKNKKELNDFSASL